VQVPPESEESQSGSPASPTGEDADRRETRERDLMRELDELTGRRVEGETRSSRPSSPDPREAPHDPSGAEEVPDE